MVAVLEAARERRADPPAAHDHDMHGGDATEQCAPEPRSVVEPNGADWSSLLARGCRRRFQADPAGSQAAQLPAGRDPLPKRIALPVFASDALSSVAYAPDEVFIMLSLAGASAYVYSWKIGIAVALVLAGGRVLPADRARLPQWRRRLRGRDRQPRPQRRDHRRKRPAVDYVLTVAVSISSGAQYAAAAIPALYGHEATVATVTGRGAGGPEPARHPGVRDVLRDPHLRIHVAILGMCAVAFPADRRATCPRWRAPTSTSTRPRATTDR